MGARLLIGFLVTLATFLSHPHIGVAIQPPARPLPTEGAPNGLTVYITCSQTDGIVPFEVNFVAGVRPVSDLIENVYWDFDSDGLADATGNPVSHTFEDAAEYEVTARVTIRGFGSHTGTRAISGHAALMTITFDDGPMSIYTHGFPILESRGIKATAYIVPAWVPDVWYMDWAEIQALHDAGWDIGSHGMTHPRLDALADDSLEYELRQSQIELQSRGFPAGHFAAPHCRYDDRVVDAIARYYVSNRVCGGINPPVADSDPYRLLSIVSWSRQTFEGYKAHIDSAVASGGWYIMTNHSVADNCGGATWCTSSQMLSDVLDYALANRVKFATISEALEMHNPVGTAGIYLAADLGRPVNMEPVGSPLSELGGTSTIRYTVLRPADVDISVYDVMGRRVRHLFAGRVSAGQYSHDWNALDDYGRMVASGTYFYLLRADNQTAGSRRIIILR